ncbi:hypothetical protein B0H14DRAFT_2618448, partial [Mycena olivaceomarginata]
LQREVPRMLLRERDRLAPKRTDAEILDPSLAIMLHLFSPSPGDQGVRFLFIFFLPTLCRELDNLYPESIVSRDLARGLLRLMRRIEDGELPMIFWSEWLTDDHEWHCLEWGRHVRSSPQSNPELLRELDQFVPPWDVFSEGLEPVEFYDVVRWLKTSTDAHVDLIDRWRSHLTESMARAGANYSDDELEERWQARTAKEAYIQGPSRSFDREVIRCWEGCLREYMSTGGG